MQHPSSVRIPVAAQRGGLGPLKGHLLVMRGVTRTQRIALPERRHTWEGEFEVTPAAARDWHRLFGASETLAAIPFTYHSPLGVRMGHEALRLVGVNFKNILYVGWHMHLARPDRTAPMVGERCRLVVSIDSLSPCSGQRAILRVRGTVLGEDGLVILTATDTMMLRNLSAADWAALEAATGAKGSTLALSQAPEPERLSAGEYRSYALDYPESLGRQYGDLSGDANFLHTNPFVLKLFGYERMFAHGMCTANKVVKTLFADEGVEAQDVSIVFKKPVFLGQTVELRVATDRFEVCDAEDTLLARGTYRPFEETRVL